MANKMADERVKGPSATSQPQLSISANTSFLFRHHHQRDSMPEGADDERIFSQSRKVRWSILAAYWAVILLALPLWWTTTSIQRLSLPISRVEDLAQKDLHFPVDIFLDSSSGVDTKVLSTKLQSLINTRLSSDVRAWLGVRVHPGLIPREFPMTYPATQTNKRHRRGCIRGQVRRWLSIFKSAGAQPRLCW